MTLTEWLLLTILILMYLMYGIYRIEGIKSQDKDWNRIDTRARAFVTMIVIPLWLPMGFYYLVKSLITGKE